MASQSSSLWGDQGTTFISQAHLNGTLQDITEQPQVPIPVSSGLMEEMNYVVLPYLEAAALGNVKFLPGKGTHIFF